LPIELSQT